MKFNARVFVTVGFPNFNGGIRVRESRFYVTKDETESHIRK